MLITQHSIKTKAAPEAIWALWSDIKTWNTWDHGIENGEIEGAFTEGAKGWLKPKGGPRVNFKILRAETNKVFHDRSSLPLTSLDFIHTLSREGDYTIVTQRVEMTGVLTFIFAKVIGSGIKKDMPLAMAKLVEIAEGKS
jgi:hypothetical protein